MSSKIYFNKPGQFSLRKGMLSVATKLHHSIAPKHAVKTARRVFLTPVKGRETNPEPQGLVKQVTETSHGKMMTYSLGNGPCWILSHGWSGSANQFFPLMEHIASAGYTALAYDHPAHGNSEGKEGHIPGFVAVLDDILSRQEDFAGVIAHSMGAATLLESEHPRLSGKPVLLVAPVLNYRENMYRVVRASGYSMPLFEKVIDEIAEQYQYTIERVDPYNKLGRRLGTSVIVHDKTDRFASFDISKQATEFSQVSLVATEGLGHGRVLKSDPLKLAFDQLATEANRL